MTDTMRREEVKQQQEEPLPYPHMASVVFLCLKQTTKPRSWCLVMTNSPWMDYISILMVLLACLPLCMYKPHEEHSIYLEVFEAVIYALLLLEMVIKMLAMGVTGYLCNNWNKFDCFINCGEVMDFVMAHYGYRWQLFQALRPMRLFGRIHSLQVLVAVLVDTLPMLGNVLFLNMLVIHIFSVVGVQLWGGQLRNRCFLGEDIPTEYNVSLSPFYLSKYGEKYPFICSPDNKGGMQHCIDIPPYQVDGETCSLAAPRNRSEVNDLEPTGANISANNCVNWNQYYNVCRPGADNPHMGAINFDNIGYSWIAIFQVITLEGWSEIMFFVMDAHSFWNCLVFILFTIMGSFIMMNVCAVVIATKFSENMVVKTEQHAVAVTIEEIFNKLMCFVEESFSKINRNNIVSPDCSDGRRNILDVVWTPCLKILKRTVASTLFDRLIMFAVVLSILALVIEHHEQPKELTHVLGISNIIFTIIFLLEMIIKLLALKFEYFKDGNNVFDFSLVIISLWEVIGKAEGKLSVLRSLRMLRFVRLLHFLPYLKRQLLVLKKTIEKAAALCLLLLFFIFIFSILGMLLFGGKFKFMSKHGEMITDRKNFDDLHWSLVTVFQILTQEDWNLVLYNAMATTSAWATLYFVALIMTGKHVLLNVLVGIVVQSFQDLAKSRKESPENDSSLTDYNEEIGSTSSGIPTAITPAPREDPAPGEDPVTKDNRSTTLIQKVLHWCKEHEDLSFYVWSSENRFRKICQRVISDSLFDHVILLFILLSCVTIAMERPGIDPKSTERLILSASLYVFSGVFLVEMLLKVLALGVFFGKDCYCRSMWNVVDGLLVILSLVHIFVSLANTGKTNMLSILKVLRLLRTLRPLRVIKRAPKLKLAVEALIASVKPIGNIVLICCASLFFFGILGVQFFKGKFYYCLGEDVRNITTKSDCLEANYQWKQKKFNFDNLPQALMSLFVMYSKDSWVNIMHDGLDAVGVDKQPVKNNNEWMLLFFISFMIMSFFLLDMFIGVMVETFHQCQQEQRKELSDKEGGADHCREPEGSPYYTSYSKLRRSIHTLCTSSTLDLFVTVVIFLCVMVMAVEHYDQPLYIRNFTEYSYFVFTAIFIGEVLLKVVAFGALRFLKDNWNVLDVGIVLVSIVSILFNELEMAAKFPINPNILRICRVLRLAQVLKAKRIRVLLKTIMKTLSQVGNICLLFTFFFFIYAALGVELFGRLECTNDYPCLGLNRHSNFKNFGKALLTLYQVCTGDNWSGILKDTLRDCPPHVATCPTYLAWVSPVFFISFVIMAQFVLVNLVVASIMMALEECNQEEYHQNPEQELMAAGQSGTTGPAMPSQRSPASHAHSEKLPELPSVQCVAVCVITL